MKFFTDIDYRALFKKYFTLCVIFALVFSVLGYLVFELGPVSPTKISSGGMPFEVAPGDGFRKIGSNLARANLIKSQIAFELLAFFAGSARKLKAGRYSLDSSMTSVDILKTLVSGSHREVRITVPEGISVYGIEKMLVDSGVLRQGELINAVEAKNLEGKLFPDTYRFFTDSSSSDVLEKFSENFESKTASLFSTDKKHMEESLILASIVQKEVPYFEDQRVVAGILKKRLAENIPLQVDATICYIKEKNRYPEAGNCYPLVPLDFKIDSNYNTYLHRGLPPGPIGNPGLFALKAALSPQSSPYWYYLSDPSTQKTIFAENLDAQNRNRAKYLK